MSELGKAEEMAEDLKQKIVDGVITQGSRLKSERDLAKEYHTSRMTARHALEMLESEGIVNRYPTRGTFVGEMRERILIDQGRELQNQSLLRSVTNSELITAGSFFKDMERLGRKPQIVFLEQPGLVAASKEITPYLGVQPGTLVLKRYRLQTADGLPYRIIE